MLQAKTADAIKQKRDTNNTERTRRHRVASPTAGQHADAMERANRTRRRWPTERWSWVGNATSGLMRRSMTSSGKTFWRRGKIETAAHDES